MANKSQAGPPQANQSKVINELWKMNVQREQEIADLRALLQQVMSASALECIVQNGFAGVIEQLAPLRMLVGEQQGLSDEAALRMETLREDLARVEIQPDDDPLRGIEFTRMGSLAS